MLSEFFSSGLNDMTSWNPEYVNSLVASLPKVDNVSGEPKKPFVCNKCYHSYTQKSHLNCHLKYECGKEPQFQCSQCPKRFKIKSNLRQHMLVHIRLNAEVS